MLNRSEVENEVYDILRDPPPEPTWLDYKLEFHENKTELLHDIICLANARYEGTRFLIFGVKNKTLKLVGIQDDLDSAQIDQILTGKIWNFKPAIMVGNVDFDDKRFGYIAIEDQPKKPYFLREFYKDQGETLQAGTIYTRHSDTNTPYKPTNNPISVEDGELEHMFRERFGLDKTPLERMKILLVEPTEYWKESLVEETGHQYFFNERQPEFGISIRRTSEVRNYAEPWVKGELGHQMNIESTVEIAEFYHNSNFLHSEVLIVFDNRHKRCVEPKKRNAGSDAVYFYEIDSVGLALQKWLVKVSGRDNSKQINTMEGAFSIPNATRVEIEGFCNKNVYCAPPVPNGEDQDIDFFIQNQKKLDEFLSEVRGHSFSSFD